MSPISIEMSFLLSDDKEGIGEGERWTEVGTTVDGSEDLELPVGGSSSSVGHADVPETDADALPADVDSALLKRSLRALSAIWKGSFPK